MKRDNAYGYQSYQVHKLDPSMSTASPVTSLCISVLISVLYYSSQQHHYSRSITMAKDRDRSLNPAAAHLKSEKQKALKKGAFALCSHFPVLKDA